MTSSAKKVLIVIALVVVVAVVILAKNLANHPNPKLPQIDNTQYSEPVPRLIDLGAGKCIPCKMMAPILEELKTEYAGKLEVLFLDVHEDPDLITEYGISIIPTQIFYDASGKELFRHEGFYSKQDILVKFKSLGVDLEKAK